MSELIRLELEEGKRAFVAILAARRAGTPAILSLGSDAYAATQARAMWRLLSVIEEDRDTRLASLKKLRAEPLAQNAISGNSAEFAALAIVLADEVVADSWARVLAVENLLVRSLANVRVELPACEAFRAAPSGDQIVILVPDGDATAEAHARFSLGDLHQSVRVVYTSAWETCAGAKLIVDADWSSPATAAKAAAFGVPIVCAQTSGATEVVRPAALYSPLFTESLADAVRVGLAARVGTASRIVDATVRSLDISAAAELPRVTFLIRTKDRPALLERALRSVAAQVGATVDAVVINDGGEAVDDLVTAFPFAQLITQSQSDYVSAAPLALERATGEFVALLDDDDALFPDHAAKLATALIRSGGAVAVADTLACYASGAQTLRATGYRRMVVEVVDRDRLLCENPISGSLRVMYRRAALERAGGFRKLSVALDYDAYLRMARGNDFVRVNGVTSLYTIFTDGRNRSIARAAEQADVHRAIWAEHPARGRPAIAAARNAYAAILAEAGAALMPAAAKTIPPIPFT